MGEDEEMERARKKEVGDDREKMEKKNEIAMMDTTDSMYTHSHTTETSTA